MLAPRLFLASATLFLAASLCRAQQSYVEPNDFSFTRVDLELLDKSNQFDRQLQEKGLVYNDPDTTKYITKVGQAVLPGGPDLQRVHWQFFVLRNPIPNAFAMPNGSIYVHTGLLAVLENEAQLAGVLAHEETHVINRHAYLGNRRYSRELEQDADLRAVYAMVDAGYSAGEMKSSFEALKREHDVDFSKKSFYQD